MEAAYKLSALVDDLLLRFAGDVRIHDHSVVPDGRRASLSLCVPLEDGNKISVIVNSSSKDDGTGYKNIFLDNHRYQYCVKSHEEALRHDRNMDIANVDVSESVMLPFGSKTSTGDRAVYEAIIKESLNGLARSRNDLENQRLERKLGVNDQPVDPDEIGRLAQLLEGAEAIGAN